MVERALPSDLELAGRHEHHVRVLEARHVAAEVAAIPRGLHAVDAVEDGRAVGLRTCGGKCEEGDDAHSWNCPAMTVWQWPPISTRSPSKRQRRTPVRALACSAVKSLRPSRSAQ